MDDYRNLDTHPYTADEKRVGALLDELAPDIGWGDDPIGFLIASYRMLAQQRRELRQEIMELRTQKKN